MSVNGCSAWTPYLDQNVVGMTEQTTGNPYTDSSCKDACISNTTCLSIDFDTRSNKCFFGFTANPTKGGAQGINHYDLNRTCGKLYLCLGMILCWLSLVGFHGLIINEGLPSLIILYKMLIYFMQIRLSLNEENVSYKKLVNHNEFLPSHQNCNIHLLGLSVDFENKDLEK